MLCICSICSSTTRGRQKLGKEYKLSLQLCLATMRIYSDNWSKVLICSCLSRMNKTCLENDLCSREKGWAVLVTLTFQLRQAVGRTFKLTDTVVNHSSSAVFVPLQEDFLNIEANNSGLARSIKWFVSYWLKKQSWFKKWMNCCSLLAFVSHLCNIVKIIFTKRCRNIFKSVCYIQAELL